MANINICMTRFYFSYIAVDGYDSIISELRPYVKKFIAGCVHGFHEAKHNELLDNCPGIKNWLSTKKLTIRSAGIIVIPAKTNQDRHIDAIDRGNNPMALNFDIENCVIPRTKMYACDIEPTLSKTRSGLNYWRYDPSANFVQVAEFDLSAPVLFNTQVPHQVCNHTDATRISVSFRFHEDPSHLLDYQ